MFPEKKILYSDSTSNFRAIAPKEFLAKEPAYCDYAGSCH